MSKIQKDFDKLFSEYKEKKIAIYGTGNNARLLLEHVSGYQFVNLVSKDYVGESICGKKVISLQEAVNVSEMMIIAAVPSSTAIVYQRIKDDVPEDYQIYDMRGVRLSGTEWYKKNSYWNTDEKQLRVLIEKHDVISFDIFDTLITRTVLEPKDVFKLVEEKLRAKGMEIPFYEWRVQAEEISTKEVTEPNIRQIYEMFRLQNDLNAEIVKEIQQLEYDTELEVICSRTVMKEILEWTISLGKKVYLTSDMYYSKEEILAILKEAGISTDVQVLISCEYGKSKANGALFELLIEKSLGLSVLHIGDNYENDIKKALQLGISTFYVKRGYEMLAESSCSFLLDQVKTEDDRRLLGYLVADFCNNPFELSMIKGKLCIENYRKLAWVVTPITVLFMSEIVKQAKNYDILLFASRDGYFLNELYNGIYCEKDGELPKGKYFYVSRSAVSSASVFSKDDIKVLCSRIDEDMKTNLKNFLELQFHIHVTDEFDRTVEDAIAQWGVEGLKERLNSLQPYILNVAEQKRQGYLQYVKNMGIEENEKLAVVDMVTRGTLIYGLQNLLKKEIGLLALGTTCVPNKYIADNRRVHSVYGNVFEKVDNTIYSVSELGELYCFLEMLYSSEEGQLFEFSEAGSPLMVDSSEYSCELVKSTQEQIKRILDKFNGEFYKMHISKEFALGCMKILYRKYSEVIEELKIQFKFDEPYGGIMKQCNLFDILSM